MKPLILTLAAGAFVLAAAAQPLGPTDTSQHFLWFSGHWSTTKKNSFIVTGGGSTGGGSTGTGSGGSSGTITIGNDGSVQMQSGDLDSWNKRWDQAVQSEDKFIQQLNDPKDNLEPSTHQLFQLLLPDAQQRKQDAQDLKIDPKQDILTPDTKPGQGQGRSVSDVMADFCQKAKPDYDEVVNWWKAHKSDKDGDLTYLQPPAFDYDCYACDSNIRNSYEAKVNDFRSKFSHPEDELVKKGMNILHVMGLMGLEPGKGMDPDTYQSLFSGNKKDPSKSGACSYMDLEDLADAVYGIANHAYRRATKMLKDNKQNFRVAAPVMKVWTSCARDVAMLGVKISDDEGLAQLADMLGYAIDYYYGEFKKHDWRQVGNATWMLNLIRDQALLGRQNIATAKEYLQRLQQVWNSFRLTVEMDIKVGKDGGWRIAHLKGECRIVPAFQQDKNQCYKWQVADENQMDVIGFIKPSELQYIDCQLITNQILLPGPSPVYIGTKSYTTTLQSLSMDFCNPGHDTIMISGFTPKPATAGLWQVPYSPNQNWGVIGMEQYFEDVYAKKKMVDNGEADRSVEEMKQKAEQLKQQMEALKAQMNGPQAAAAYQKVQTLPNQMRGMMSAPVVGKMTWIDFLLPVQNNEPVIVDKMYDAKQINPKAASVIVYGHYTIHIENKLDGKTANINM